MGFFCCFPVPVLPESVSNMKQSPHQKDLCCNFAVDHAELFFARVKPPAGKSALPAVNLQN
jgi:hypothetical protein